MIIGLTGTIGSGKSLVAGMLEELGAYVIDTDALAREVVEPRTEGWSAVVDAFGESVLQADGAIDRKKLAAVVFADPAALGRLNSILHPLIAKLTAERISQTPAGAHTVLVVPLLFESGFDKIVQSKWVVTAQHDDLVSRITSRDGCTGDEALGRISSQMPQDQKAALADVIIDNSGTIEQTRGRVREAFSKIA